MDTFKFYSDLKKKKKKNTVETRITIESGQSDISGLEQL